MKSNQARIFELSTSRIIFFLLFLACFAITEVGRFIYRPYIYANHIFDFWIADTIGNFTGSIAIIYFDFSIVNPTFKKGRIFLILITAGLCVYELVQYILPGTNTCDWRDIIATLLAGLISWGIYELIAKKYPTEG